MTKPISRPAAKSTAPPAAKSTAPPAAAPIARTAVQPVGHSIATPIAKIDPAQLWGLNYRMTMSVLAGVAPAVRALSLEVKELFLLAAIEEHPHPADLARELLMPKPTVTVLVKRLEAAGYVRREIDAADLRRHRLRLTAAGHKVTTRSLALLSEAFGQRLARLSVVEQTQLQAIIEKMS